jgi:hypothetical protein
MLKYVVAVVALVFALVGCSEPPIVFDDRPLDTLVGVEKTHESITNTLDVMDEAVKTGREKDTGGIFSDQWNTLGGGLLLLKDKYPALYARIKDAIEDRDLRIKELRAEVRQLEETVMSQSSTIEAYKQRSDADGRAFMWLLTAIGVGGFAASLALFVFMGKIFIAAPIALAVGSISLVAVAQMVLEHSRLVGYIALAIFALSLLFSAGAAIWTFATTSRYAIKLVEILKGKLPDDIRVKVFGNKLEPGMAHSLASPTIEAVVSEVRSTLK